MSKLKEAREENAELDRRLAAHAVRAAEIDREINALADVVVTGKRALTEEEDAKLADLRRQKASVNELRAVLMEQKAAASARLAQAEADNEAERRAPAVDDPDAAAAAQAAVRGGARIEVGKLRIEDDPNKGFRTPREFFQAVMAAGRGHRMDERLNLLRVKPQAAAGSDEAGVYSDPHGGWVVPIGFSPDPMSLQPEGDPSAGRTRPFPMANPVVTIPARVDKNHSTSVSGGLIVTRRPETVQAQSSRMEFEKITMRATSLFGLTYATEEIITDSPISFIAMLESSFRQEFGAKAIDEKLNGTGVGEYEGILNSPALVTVPKESGQAADTINYENVKKMRARCWGYARAIWLANHDTMPDLMSMVQVVGTGGAPVYQPSAQEDRPDLLLGRPIFYTEYCKSIGDVGDIVCVNWFEYLEGTYQPLQTAESIHVRFVEHERAFKFWLRNDGRGWWRSPLTPKHSNKTMSPFVALASR